MQRNFILLEIRTKDEFVAGIRNVLRCQELAWPIFKGSGVLLQECSGMSLLEKIKNFYTSLNTGLFTPPFLPKYQRKLSDVKII